MPNIVGTEFAADKVDYGYEMPETLSRETVVSPSDLLDDPFVADDTFQDQGPGSMEIYKLDLSKEKTLLTATTPSTNLPSKNKSKAPKKTDHLKSKTKTNQEIKSTTTNANISHRQSNFFEEQLTETPLVNRDAFGVGGVPELQVGCEGLEASLSSHKAKRSIDTLDKEKGSVPASVLLDVTPVSLDLDDVLSYDEEEYEEMDELFKLKKQEIVTKKNKPNRGDMDASHLNSDHLDEFRRPEKLPVRGDLGKSTPTNSSKFVTDQKKLSKRSLTNFQTKNYEETKPKREIVSLDDDDASRSHGRRLLWFAETNTEGFADGKSERKRTRRSIDWGFGEDEGVVSSDELQTVNERRRQHEMRYHQDTSRRRNQHHELNTDDIRQQYEKLLEQQRREEHLQMQQANRRALSRWEEEEKRRRDEMRRRQYEEYRKRIDLTSTPRTDDEEIRRRQMEEQYRQEVTRNRTQEMARRNEEELRRRDEEERRRRLQEEEMRKRPQNKWQEENLKSDSKTSSVNDEERKRRLHDEEMRRWEEERRRRLEEIRKQEQYRLQQEAQRKREEEERRRQEDSMRNLSEDDRRRLEQRRREWSEKRKQDNENEKRRQQPPSNLMRPEHPVSQPNDIRQRDQDEKRRQQEEREREQKLQEYIARNRPIIVNRPDRRLEEERRHYRPEENRDPRTNVNRNDEEYRRRMQKQREREEEGRKLQDYIRRNQPNVSSRDNQSIAAGRNWFEERRLIEEARHRDRYPDPGARKAHGPSAPTYIDPRSLPEEVRRRQQETVRRLDEEKRRRQYEAEERRKEFARQWEQERERRLREERTRKETARQEEEARRTQSRRYEEDRKRQEVARIQAERRRQEMLRERSRNEAGRTTQPEATRPINYQDPHLLAEYRRRQDSRPIPSNLMRAEEARRAATERERQRLEVERRQQEESRYVSGPLGTVLRKNEVFAWRNASQLYLSPSY